MGRSKSAAQASILPARIAVDEGDDDGESEDALCCQSRAEEEARLAREAAYGSIQDMIFFDFDRSDLREDARQTLQAKAEALRQFPDVRVRIEGHADERAVVAEEVEQRGIVVHQVR